MNTRAAGRGTTTAGIAVTTDAVTTVAAAGERGRQGTRRGVIYQPGYTLTKSATFPENRTTSVSRLLTGSSTVPFHRGGRCFVRLPVSRSLTGSSTVPVHREGGSRQRMSGPSTMSHPALWTCPACGRPLTVALNPEGGEAGAHRPLEISRASAAAHACTPAARFPQFHSASSSSSITGYEPASCQPWQPPVSAGAEDDEGVISQSEYTLTKPSSCPNHRDHVICRKRRPCLAPSSRVQAMPGPDPPHHAKPRREVFSCRAPPSSGLPQRSHLLDVEPPVVAALLRPPVAEPDTTPARGQPRRQLIPVHQLRTEVGHADDRPRAVELRPRVQDTLPPHHHRRHELRLGAHLLELRRSGPRRNGTPRSRSSSPRAPAAPALSSGRWLRSLPEALPAVPWNCRQRRDRGTVGTRVVGAAGRRRRCGRRRA